MTLVRLCGTYKVDDDTLTKVSEQEPSKMRLYRIAERSDNTKHYCREYLEEGIRQYVRGLSAFEERIVLDEMIKKGALQPM